jgi:hypothetical protein
MQGGASGHVPDAAGPGAGKPESPNPRTWLQNVARDTATETGLSAVLGTVGSLAAGPIGRKLGSRAGLVAARRMGGSAPTPEGAAPARKRKPRKRTPTS